jgi:hypothetical protein
MRHEKLLYALCDRGRRGPQRSEDIVYELGCTLEQFYNGATRKLKMNKTVVCSACKGKGGANISQCSDCHGRVRIHPLPVNPLSPHTHVCSLFVSLLRHTVLRLRRQSQCPLGALPHTHVAPFVP